MNSRVVEGNPHLAIPCQRTLSDNKVEAKPTFPLVLKLKPPR